LLVAVCGRRRSMSTHQVGSTSLRKPASVFGADFRPAV
jgi:hypothetical protein